MDHPVRVPPAPRTQWLFGLYESFRRATRPRAASHVGHDRVHRSHRIRRREHRPADDDEVGAGGLDMTGGPDWNGLTIDEWLTYASPESLSLMVADTGLPGKKRAPPVAMKMLPSKSANGFPPPNVTEKFCTPIRRS